MRVHSLVLRRAQTTELRDRSTDRKARPTCYVAGIWKMSSKNLELSRQRAPQLLEDRKQPVGAVVVATKSVRALRTDDIMFS